MFRFQLQTLMGVCYLAFTLLTPPKCLAQSGTNGGSSSGGEGGSSYIGQTQKRRSLERFNILDWMTRQKQIIAEQDRKWGGGGSRSSWFPDLVITARSTPTKLSRDGTELGSVRDSLGRIQLLFNDAISTGSKTRNLNVDIGFEVFSTLKDGFVAASGVSQNFYDEKAIGGGIVFRPMGRSSQDTGLLLKGGYLDVKEKGIWSASANEQNLFSTYFGAEFKLYLLNFLGARAEYFTSLETHSESLGGKWFKQEFIYGGFLEIYLIELEAHVMWSEMLWTPQAGGAAQKDRVSGAGFSASLFF